jgi:hypothetical protein
MPRERDRHGEDFDSSRVLSAGISLGQPWLTLYSAAAACRVILLSPSEPGL